MAGMYVQPACLPSDNTPYTEDLDCYISGWGATSLGGYHFFSSMKFLFNIKKWQRIVQLHVQNSYIDTHILGTVVQKQLS